MTPVFLCALDDVPDGGSAGFAAGEAGEFGFRNGVMLIRRGGEVFAYENSCPHTGAPLDFTPGRFLTRDGGHILCAVHGALFRIEDGHCVSGPCAGGALRPVSISIIEGAVHLND